MDFDAIMGQDALREFGAIINCSKMVAMIQGVDLSLHGPLIKLETEQLRTLKRNQSVFYG
jgi:hypothetical protein